ncbi:sulfotransferase family protein [Crateriforma spongiae]|uniref:sulfotransferase family protein n=1 Tax=Crateriforma spongiae TaxID=2724528 RepID=UPI001F19C723|nr:sulfotransferase [Crateriforma spongiae]
MLETSDTHSNGGSTVGTCPLALIASQPRAGSTLLQTMLGKHPDVVSAGETWLLLPLVYALESRTHGHPMPFDGELADQAVDDFAKSMLPGGRRSIERAMATMVNGIFDQARNAAGQKMLVDKTPRYYRIIDEILRILDDVRMVLLIRNPLAVFSSILDTWIRGNWPYIAVHRDDLLMAPVHLAVASECGDRRLRTVRYEDLTADPDSVLADLQRFLGLQLTGGLADYGEATHRRFGDPKGIGLHRCANAQSIDKWVCRAGQDPVHWRMLDDYRQMLGSELLQRLGYDDRQLADQLAQVRPKAVGLVPPLTTFLRRPVKSKMRRSIKSRIRLAQAISQRPTTPLTKSA